MKTAPSEGSQAGQFTLEIQVQSKDIDELNHVNNVVYLQWVQNVAAAHWNELASAEIKAAHVWVALRHEIDYVNPAFLGDKVTARTWVSSVEGARSTRHVEFHTNGKCLAKATTHWCLLDATSFKPKRIGPEIRKALEG